MKTSQVVRIRNAQMEVTRADLPYGHIQASWLHGRFYEQRMLDYIAARYAGGEFLDIGACMGNHSVYFALYCNPDHVYAFEPVAEHYQHMQRNIQLNQSQIKCKVTGYCLAVGADEICGRMILPEDGNEGMWEFTGDCGGDTQMQPIDSFGFGNVTLMKIDAEKHEMAILHGAMETIRFSKPAIFVEAVTDADVERVMDLLSPLGYMIHGQFNRTPTFELVAD